jgi:Kef-type K+ transport system membrane component KefB
MDLPASVFLGSLLLSLVSISAGIQAIAEIGVIPLLSAVGLETDS